MTIQERRQAIAAALSTVDGVRGLTATPGSPRTGDAWARWAGSTREDGGAPAFLAAWRVRVFPPQDTEERAEDWWDGVWLALQDALPPVLFVVRAEAAVWSTSAGNRLVYDIYGDCEE